MTRPYLVALPPGAMRRPDFPAINWRATARRIEAEDAADAAGLFVESYGGTRSGLREVEPWDGARVFAYFVSGEKRGLVLVSDER